MKYTLTLLTTLLLAPIIVPHAAEPVAIQNPLRLPPDCIPCEHIAIGEPDDYKLPAAGAAGKKTIVTVSTSTPELPRKSEGDVIELKDGRLLLVSMEFGGDGNDFATTRLVAHESSDGGLTWGGHRVITETAPGDVNVYSPNLIRAQDGGVLLFFPKFRSHYGKRSPLTAAVSKDNGRTWQHVRDIETDPKRAFSNPGCRFTRDGRAILNYWTCEYLPDWRMQDIIDLRVAVIDTAWFYESSAKAQ